MNFGLRNAPSTFQRFINEVLFGLELFFPYLDDILVASENEEHKTHLKLVFDRLQKYGLRVNISKSTLGVTHLEFLGYLITPEGSKPLLEKVDAILSYKLPETIQEAKENFENCKQDLAHSTLLSFPGPNLQLALFTKASNFAIGSVLQQFETGNTEGKNKDDVGVAIVPQTISRHLAEANLKSKRPFRALPLTPEHRQLRLQWCQSRSMWNVTDWQKVVFSDESRFVLGTDNNRVRVWRRPGERYNSPHTVLRHTARTAGVMV
ncbi:retrovirus-related Pol polyprotein from transposon opus [Trichonephila clavipes]|uniref:Retrovirus-related Pol polyprotein from transposon opus n=1 Tax=Trichonephila clavipes TaxID=2585209 RepID=A0A8X6UYX8_TRICX|nr:retrovirus-related Pol polyprotein from transposon opus [Trichonephila clavipes]